MHNIPSPKRMTQFLSCLKEVRFRFILFVYFQNKAKLKTRIACLILERGHLKVLADLIKRLQDYSFTVSYYLPNNIAHTNEKTYLLDSCVVRKMILL